MAINGTRKINNYTYAVEADEFLVITDVSLKLGGDDFGPDPHQYLEVALAGCTAITVEMYARRKKIALESVDVKVKIIEEGTTNRIKRNIKLVGNLTLEEREKLIVIAQKCPIHRFLTRGAEIQTEEIL